jgi:hypothetical protein
MRPVDVIYRQVNGFGEAQPHAVGNKPERQVHESRRDYRRQSFCPPCPGALMSRGVSGITYRSGIFPTDSCGVNTHADRSPYSSFLGHILWLLGHRFTLEPRRVLVEVDGDGCGGFRRHCLSCPLLL